MENVNRLLDNVQENIPLSEQTTFNIGGPAKYFYVARGAGELKKAVETAKYLRMDYYVLGAGSNVLASDQGFDGLVIKYQSSKFRIEDFAIQAEAGVSLGRLVLESAGAGLGGLEWAAGIPGTIGGAVYGNAGAFGHSIGETVDRVEVLDIASMAVNWLDQASCEFVYRGSVFKKGKYVILNVSLKLAKGDPDAVRKAVNENIAKRKDRHPIGYPNAGSIFKNVIIKDNQEKFEKIARNFPEAEEFRAAGMLPAGWLIEKCDLKGKEIGGAAVSDRHANFILNIRDAQARDVMILISLIKQKVRVNFDIQLEEEIRHLGF